MAKNKTKIEGMDEVIQLFKDMEEVPQKCVNKSAKKGIQIAKKDVKNNGGWIDQTGTLRKSIKEKAEKTKLKGKKVYDLMPDAKYNDDFVKITKNNKRYYYPASVEYGFKTKNGGYSPGFHSFRDSLIDNKSEIEKEVIETLIEEIDKLK